MREETTVVNVKVANLRPEYDNLKEWCEDPANVYIGRRGIVFVDGVRYPKEDSPWCNPFKVKAGVLGRAEAIEKYKKYIIARLKAEPGLTAALVALRGKRLGCWCCPEACHGDVLVELINKSE